MRQLVSLNINWCYLLLISKHGTAPIPALYLMSFCYCLRASAASHARMESSSFRPSGAGGTSNGFFVKSLDQSVPIGQITHSMEEKKKAQQVARQHAITLQVGVSTEVQHAIDVQDDEDKYQPSSLTRRTTPSPMSPDNRILEVQLPPKAVTVCGLCLRP
jgi:hypothetical protein